MRQLTYHVASLDLLPASLSRLQDDLAAADPNRTLVLMATNLPTLDQVALAARSVSRALPGAQVVGATMLGPVGEGTRVPVGIDLSVLSFETARVDVLRYDCSLMDADQAGRRLSDDLRQTADARCVVMVSAGIMPDQLLHSISHDLDGIPVFGVPAGYDVNHQDMARVVVDGSLHKTMAVCVILSGPDLRVRVGRSFGWRPFGKRLRVTSGDGHEVVTGIDGVTPGALYGRYLHLDAGQPDYIDLYAFPIVTGTGPSMTANVPTWIGDDGSFRFAKRMPLGATVSLGYAREADLLHETLSLANDLADLDPQGLLVAYCESRTIFLGNDLADREQGYLRTACPQALVCYGFGEVLREGGRGGYRNNTTTALALREGEPSPAGTRAPISDYGIDQATTANPRLLGRIVSFLEEATRDLRRFSDYDEMTGLLRRSAMEGWLSERWASPPPDAPLTVAMVDVDAFKSVNDRFGHAIGDRVLVAVAQALQAEAGPGAAVSRWGGDEFLCAALEGEAWAQGLAVRARQRLAETDLSSVPRLAISVGIAFQLGQDEDLDSLLHRADLALYRSKHEGGDQVTTWSEGLEGELATDTQEPTFLIDAVGAMERSLLPIMVFRSVGPHSEALVLSDGYCRMVGASREENSSRPSSWDARRVHPDDAAALEAVPESLRLHDTASFSYRLLVGGSYHRVRAMAQRLKFRSEGDLVACVFHDLTADDAAITMPTRRDERGEEAVDPVGPEARALLEPLALPLALLLKEDGLYRFVLVSDGACELYGEDRPSLERYLTNRSFDKTHPDDAALLLRTGARMGHGSELGVSFRLRVHGGEDYHQILVQAFPLRVPSGRDLSLVCYTDLDEAGVRDKAERELFRQEGTDDVYHDRLTGLPNLGYYRMFAAGKAGEVADRGGQPAVTFLDVRGMRAYNDRHGYEQGDALLRAAGEEVSRAYPDALVARYTEDHFVVVGPLAGAVSSAQRARDGLVRLAHDELVDLDAGTYPLASRDEDMATAADRARLAADFVSARVGEHWRLYDREVADHYARRDYVLGSWQRAIDQGWVRAYFQPVVDSFSRAITGYEVLARWQDPERGLLSPGDFIPTLEEAGLLYHLDMEVLRQAAEHQGMRLRRGWEAVPVSVNLSRHDLSVPGLHETVNATLAGYGVPRDLIAFEVTETALVDHGDLVRQHLARFHDDGYLVYLDDFGSGYSSLNTLQDFDFDVVKIDMGFLRHANEKTPAILSDVVDMAKRLGMATLAEGVETEEEAGFLHGIGCGMLQGYLYSQPLPADDVRAVKLERGLRFETGERRAFFHDLGRVNVLDVGSPLPQNPPRPLAEQYPMLLVVRDGGKVSVAYANDQARANLVQLGYATLEDFGRFVDQLEGPGSVREGLRLADEGGEAVLNYVGERYRARVSYKLVARRGSLSGYQVVAHDPLIAGDEEPDLRAVAYWRMAEGR